MIDTLIRDLEAAAAPLAIELDRITRALAILREETPETPVEPQEPVVGTFTAESAARAIQRRKSPPKAPMEPHRPDRPHRKERQTRPTLRADIPVRVIHNVRDLSARGASHREILEIVNRDRSDPIGISTIGSIIKGRSWFGEVD